MIRLWNRRGGEGASQALRCIGHELSCDAPLPTLLNRAVRTAWAKARRRAFTPPTIVALLALTAPAFAQPAPPAAAQPRQHISIGYVEIAGDSGSEPVRAYERLVLKTREHPFPGAQVGVDEAATLVRVINTEFALERITVKSPADVAPAVAQAMEQKGIHFFLIDAPGEAYRPLAAAVKGRDALLFNVSAPDDS